MLFCVENSSCLFCLTTTIQLTRGAFNFWDHGAHIPLIRERDHSASATLGKPAPAPPDGEQEHGGGERRPQLPEHDQCPEAPEDEARLRQGERQRHPHVVPPGADPRRWPSASGAKPCMGRPMLVCGGATGDQCDFSTFFSGEFIGSGVERDTVAGWVKMAEKRDTPMVGEGCPLGLIDRF